MLNGTGIDRQGRPGRPTGMDKPGKADMGLWGYAHGWVRLISFGPVVPGQT
jgi:hypothetical protein